MAWLILIGSGVFEAVWAVALGKSDGFSNLSATLVFAVAIVISMAGLAIAMKEIPTGTAYAIWTGTGAGLTVLYGMLTGAESAAVLRVLLLIGLVCCVLGLKLVGDH